MLGPLGWRLLVAFAGIAVAAVGLLAALAVGATRSEVSSLVRSQQDATGRDVAVALGVAHQRAAGWVGADLSAAYALASAAGAQLTVTDAAGRPLPTDPWEDMWSGMWEGQRHDRDWGESSNMQGMSTAGNTAPAVAPGGRSVTVPVTAAGQRVGTASLLFPTGGGASAAEQARDVIVRNVGLAALLALTVALGVGLAVSRRISRPLVALTAAARAVEYGGPGRGVPVPQAPGELGELSRAFARMTDALAHQEDARRALAADVAHELRTPVTILRAETEQLLDGIAEPTQDRVASLHDETLRLGRIVEDLGTLTAADGAALSLHRESVDLAEVVAGRVGAFRGRLEEADLRLVTDLRPAPLDADPARLDQVVANLLANAAKFTPAGGRVTVTVDQVGHWAELSVSDNGPGIPPDELPRVFERFWRGRGAAGTGGSGVGLAVVAELVRAHHGTVHAANLPTGGARFTVRLPLAHVSAPRRSVGR